MAFLNKAHVLAAFIVALLLVAYSAEAVRICKSPSETYPVGDECKTTLCVSTCIEENFTGGYCKHKLSDDLGKDGKTPKCVCTKQCEGDDPPVLPEAMGVAN